MTLRNEVFDALGAATAAQKLVYDPRDDYYEQRAAYAKAENQRRKEERDEQKAGSAAGIAAAAARKAAATGVPTSASSQTPNMPTVPGVPSVPQLSQTLPEFDPSQAAGPGNVPQDAAGGMIKPKAIKLRFRPGGPVPRDSDLDDDPDDTDDEIDEMEREEQKLRAKRGPQGTPRNPNLSRPDEEALLREPYNADEPWPDDTFPEASPENPGTARHPRAFREGGEVEEENPSDRIVQQLLAQSGADILSNRQREYGMQNTTGVAGRDKRPTPQPPSEEEQRVRAETQPNSRARLGVLPVPPPPPASVEGSPVIPQPYPDRRVTGLDETGVEGSPNIAPLLAAYTPRNVTGQDDIYAPEGVAPPPRKAGADDESRIADEGAPNARARRPSSVPPAGRNEVDETELSGIPKVPTSSRAGRALDNLATPSDEARRFTQEMELQQKRRAANPGWFEQTTEEERTRRAAEVADLDRQIAAGRNNPPVGAGAGVAPGTQQAAAAPGTSSPSPHGTTTSPAPPPGAGATNAPSTAPKSGEGYQRFQPTERMAMRPDAPDWNPLGMDLKAPARSAAGGSGGGAPAGGQPPRLSMSDPNRSAAFDPTPGGADMTDPTRRHTTTELAQAMVGAVQTAQLGPNGQLPVVGDKAISRPVGQQLVQAYSQNGALEPGEAALAGMMGMYRVLLKQNKIAEANSMAYSVMQYANLEASSHAYVAADRVRAGDFGGALRNVAAAATWIPDGMKHEVGPDGKSMVTRDYNGKVTAVTPIDGRWLLAAIEGFKNGDLLWQSLASAAEHLKGSPDKNAEGRELGKEIQRNTIRLQQQRLGKGVTGPKGPAQVTDLERRAAQILHNLGGTAPTQPTAQVAQGDRVEPDPATEYPTGYDYNEQPAAGG